MISHFPSFYQRRKFYKIRSQNNVRINRSFCSFSQDFFTVCDNTGRQLCQIHAYQMDVIFGYQPISSKRSFRQNDFCKNGDIAVESTLVWVRFKSRSTCTRCRWSQANQDRDWQILRASDRESEALSQKTCTPYRLGQACPCHRVGYLHLRAYARSITQEEQRQEDADSRSHGRAVPGTRSVHLHVMDF